MLPDVAAYFLEQVLAIASNEYEPFDKDVLYVECVTQSNGLTFFEFSMDDRSSNLEFYNDNIDYQWSMEEKVNGMDSMLREPSRAGWKMRS